MNDEYEASLSVPLTQPRTKTNKGLRIDIVNHSIGTFDQRVDAMDNPNFSRSSVSPLSQLLSNH